LLSHELHAGPVPLRHRSRWRNQGNRKVPKANLLGASPSSATGGSVKAEGLGDGLTHAKAPIAKLRCKKTCRGNGGPPHCAIRQCNREKGFDGCWQCEGFKTCAKLEFLNAGHGDAHLKNLSQIKRSGATAFVEGKRHWRTAITSR